MLTICQHPKSGSWLLDGIASSTSGMMSKGQGGRSEELKLMPL
jgi:hypothetical protein